MASTAKTYALSRAAAAFALGGLAVLVVHQPLVALLHVLGFTPIAPYSLRATRPSGCARIPVADFLGRGLDHPDRLDIGSPAARLGLLCRCGRPRGAASKPDDLVRHLSAKGSRPRQRRRVDRPLQCTPRQWHLGSRVCGCMVLDIRCASVDGHESGRALI